ncbi:MarR family winged helix-turn-helix transcriptional regulator [Maritalea mobilis]|uniref:HTH marR-type domain-containing protein n=1 Tax=[Roseibacterium] beibuensis TaxID=1193142 RepID=A0ABP9KW80_9RHOB|nr:MULTISPECIES: MarR family winged helix-turn-helix transcriptional regulator [Alphaproteobacteria]MBY6201273.1 MarR family winged helix-turn-helix transcriptional regulator [Maritalea mobilis]MCS6622299.1 MarR family winged helix-turn-helix transcriptional regulator [Roseibacterium beibuensis]
MPKREETIRDELTEAGIAEPTLDAAFAVDAILQKWRRRVVKRELGTRALNELGLDLDLAQLDALMAVWAPVNEFDDSPDGETMVATVADRLGIDPSRASRLTADLIRLGLIRRAVSQVDGRRTILEPTDLGHEVVRAVRLYKFAALGDFLSGWTEEEVATFLPLLDRFTTWSEQSDRFPQHLRDRIETLRTTLPKLGET